jgi:hypothetical protein
LTDKNDLPKSVHSQDHDGTKNALCEDESTESLAAKVMEYQEKLSHAEKEILTAERAAFIMTNVAVSAERDAASEKEVLMTRIEELEEQLDLLSQRLESVNEENDRIIAKEVSNLSLWYDRINFLESSIDEMSEELNQRSDRILVLEARIKEMESLLAETTHREHRLRDDILLLQAVRQANGKIYEDEAESSSSAAAMRLQSDIEEELKSRVLQLESSVQLLTEEKAILMAQLDANRPNHNGSHSPGALDLSFGSDETGDISRSEDHEHAEEELQKSHQVIEEQRVQIIALEESLAELQASRSSLIEELSDHREYQQQRILHETEVRNMLVDLEKEKDAEYLLRELINTKVNYAMLDNEHTKAKNAIVGLKRQLSSAEDRIRSATLTESPAYNRNRSATQQSAGGTRSRSITNASSGIEKLLFPTSSAAGNLLRLFDNDGGSKKANPTPGRKLSKSTDRSSPRKPGPLMKTS